MGNRDEGQQFPEPGLWDPSSSRPPQLNKSVCGCRCGRASARMKGSDVDSRDDDEGSTLVNSDVSDGGDDALAQSTSYENAESQALVGTRPSLIRDPDMSFSRRDMAVHSPPNRRRSGSEYSDSAGSLENGPGSDDHSIFSSDSRSIRPMSPGPGVGAWVEDLPFEYYFLVRPLRLTPQHQYCRGLVASHLVLDDGDFFGR